MINEETRIAETSKFVLFRENWNALTKNAPQSVENKEKNPPIPSHTRLRRKSVNVFVDSKDVVLDTVVEFECPSPFHSDRVKIREESSIGMENFNNCWMKLPESTVAIMLVALKPEMRSLDSSILNLQTWRMTLCLYRQHMLK